MKRAAFLILVPLLAARALAAEPGPSMPDFVRVQIKEGRLMFDLPRVPKRDPGTPSASVQLFSGELRDVSGIATISCSPNRDFGVSVRRDDGDQKITDLISSSVLGGCQISRQVLEQGSRSSITLQFPLGIPLNGAFTGSYKLKIIEANEVVTTLSERTFAELWIKHPDEVNKYIKPLLESLDLQGVFFVGRKDAALVLGPLPDSLLSIKAQIETLLPKLDDDSWAVRTAAAKELDAIGINAIPIINSLDLKSMPAETRSRLTGFVERMKKQQTPDRRIDNVDFLMLCLAVDDPEIPALAKQRLEAITGKQLDFNEKAALADRQAAAEKLRLALLAQQLTH